VGGRLFLDAGLVLTTDAAGGYAVGGLSRGAHEAFVVAPGRVRTRVLFDTTARAETELDISLTRGGKVVGRVTDMDGRPIPGAWVGRRATGADFSVNGLFAPCADDGRFEYDGVEAGQQVTLSAGAPGFADGMLPWLAVPADGRPLERNFRLRPQPGDRPAGPAGPAGPAEVRRVVSGMIRGPDQTPAAGVVVCWGYSWGAELGMGAPRTRTDTAGRFRLVVPDAEGTLAVLPHDLTPQFPRVDAGGDREVEVTLQTGHTARGRVTDDAGRPVRGVHVTAVAPAPDARFPYWLTEAAVRTHAEGGFEVKGVPAHASFDFLKPGFTALRSAALQLDGAVNAVTMAHGGALMGRVLDQDGKPIRSFRLVVECPPNTGGTDASTRLVGGYRTVGVRFTSADGRFLLTGVGAAAACRVTAIAPGHGDAVADRVTAAPLNRLNQQESVALRAGPVVRLRVRVVTAGGRPVAGAGVMLVNGPSAPGESVLWGHFFGGWEDVLTDRTGADGWAKFPVIGFRTARVLVRAPGYGRLRLDWRAGQGTLKAELAPEAVITGALRGATGAPVAAGLVNLSGGGHQIHATVELADGGRFRIGALPAGEWTATAFGEGGRGGDRVTVTAGETKELDILVTKE
jgi:protocatechuate 3,4-dioxygenase beta subunit